MLDAVANEGALGGISPNVQQSEQEPHPGLAKCAAPATQPTSEDGVAPLFDAPTGEAFEDQQRKRQAEERRQLAAEARAKDRKESARARAQDDLSWWFTTSIALRGQAYEGNGGENFHAGNPEAHDGGLGWHSFIDADDEAELNANPSWKSRSVYIFHRNSRGVSLDEIAWRQSESRRWMTFGRLSGDNPSARQHLALRDSRHRAALARYSRIANVLGSLAPDVVETLRAAYGPMRGDCPIWLRDVFALKVEDVPVVENGRQKYREVPRMETRRGSGELPQQVVIDGEPVVDRVPITAPTTTISAIELVLDTAKLYGAFTNRKREDAAEPEPAPILVDEIISLREAAKRLECSTAWLKRYVSRKKNACLVLCGKPRAMVPWPRIASHLAMDGELKTLAPDVQADLAAAGNRRRAIDDARLAQALRPSDGPSRAAVLRWFAEEAHNRHSNTKPLRLVEAARVEAQGRLYAALEVYTAQVNAARAKAMEPEVKRVEAFEREVGAALRTAA